MTSYSKDIVLDLQNMKYVVFASSINIQVESIGYTINTQLHMEHMHCTVEMGILIRNVEAFLYTITVSNPNIPSHNVVAMQ